ncbi:hypothetical protein GEMRC1_002661 [Eukaryota sp. GEM-RC1]
MKSILAPVLAATCSLSSETENQGTPGWDLLCSSTIIELLKEQKESTDSVSCIVLVGSRFGAQALSIALSHHSDLEGLNIDYVMGGSLSSFAEQMISAKLEKLRRGDLHVLVGTSILEEGIDVPSVSLVINTFVKPHGTSFIQACGRVRAASGRYVALILANRQEEYVARAQIRASALHYGVEQYVVASTVGDLPTSESSDDDIIPLPQQREVLSGLRNLELQTRNPSPSTSHCGMGGIPESVAAPYRRFMPKMQFPGVLVGNKNPVSVIKETVDAVPWIRTVSYECIDSMSASHMTSSERFHGNVIFTFANGKQHVFDGSTGKTKKECNKNSAQLFLDNYSDNMEIICSISQE